MIIGLREEDVSLQQRIIFPQALFAFMAIAQVEGRLPALFDAIMSTALSHIAGAVIKKRAFLLLLCLPDLLSLQPLWVCVSDFVRECLSACVCGQMLSPDLHLSLYDAFSKTYLQRLENFFFVSSLADNPNVTLFHRYTPKKGSSTLQNICFRWLKTQSCIC